jgi:predicted MPP superfamily phosphohydrolase
MNFYTPFRTGLWISLVFVVLDLTWLSLLPVFQISYGNVPVTLTEFGIMRGGLYGLWFIVFAGRSWAEQKGPRRGANWLLTGANLLVLALGLYGFYIEPSQLTVSRIEVQVPGLTRPARIVQLSDIHVERTSVRERAIPALVASLNPDMLVLTGDYISKLYPNDAQTREDLRSLVAQLHAPLGIYAVNGNVETPAKMRQLLDGVGIHILANQIVRVPELGDHFVIVGVNLVKYSPDQRALTALMRQVQPDDFSMLLYHKPEIAYKARDLGVDLFLTGHTHGGQVRLPFYGAIYTNSRLGKAYEMGRYQLDQMTMFVSRGIGMGGTIAPRVRFLCPPEVVVIDLVPVKTAAP